MGEYPELGAALTLLSEVSMTGILHMLEFMTADQLTEAHLDPRVWEDMDKFVEAANILKGELKGLWPYYRIIRPWDSTLQATNFKYLVRCAIAWKKQFADKTFSQVQELRRLPGVPEILLKKATKPSTVKRTKGLRGDELAILIIDVGRLLASDDLRMGMKQISIF